MQISVAVLLKMFNTFLPLGGIWNTSENNTTQRTYPIFPNLVQDDLIAIDFKRLQILHLLNTVY